MLARRFSSLAVRSLRETTTTSITLGNASAALGAAGARRDWSGRSISGIDVATSATIFKKTTLGFLSPLSCRLFSSSDAVAEDAVSPRLTDKSLLQTGAFIGGEFVDAGRDETTSSPSSSSSSTSNNNGSSSSSSSSPSSSSTGEPGKNNIGKTYEVVNPATAGVVARVARCGGVEATVAVEEAAAAFAGWKNRPARERAAVLSEWARLIAESSEDLATIVSLESGKPLAEARNELSSAVDAVTWSAADDAQQSRRTPLVVLVALALAELARRAGVPPGVFNVVSGDAAAIGEAFLKSEAVRKIGFTGSTAVGR